MSFYIYGFRIGGDPECRYIGQTAQEPNKRLAYLTSEAKRAKRQNARHIEYGGRPLNPDGFHEWLVRNEGNIDAFKIARVETRGEALATERAIVALILRLDHRLFNRHSVPAEKRIDWRVHGFAA